MKIAISATGPKLDDAVDPRFERCQYFVIVDTESAEVEGVENTKMMADGGAGVATAQMIADKGAKVVLTGNCGPNAYETLFAADLQVVTGVSGIVRDAVEGFKSGKQQSASQPNVGAHFGTGGGGRIAAGVGRQSVDADQGLEALKGHIKILEGHLESVQQRLDELESQRR